MKASRKWLKAILALGVRNYNPASIATKLVGFLLFDNFFLDLAKFQDLDIFSLFNLFDLNKFLDFLLCSTQFLPILNLLILLLPSFFLKVGLLLLFLLKANFLLSFLPEASLLVNSVIFNIEVNGVTILLKP